LHAVQLNSDKFVKTLRLYIVLCLALTLFYTPNAVEGQNENAPAQAALKIIPSKLLVAEENTLPLVNVTVENVEGLFAWQIKVYFDATILNITKEQIKYPENHVFSGKTFLNITPRVSSDTHGFYALFGTTLVGDEQGFSGSGILCQLNFTKVSLGISTLNFSTPIWEDTYLLDASLNCILTEVLDNKQSGSLTLEFDRESLYIYEKDRGIILSGSLIPKEENAKVIIYYRDSESQWLKIAEATTDSSGLYSFTWKPTNSGIFYLTAEWYGNEKTNPAISGIGTVSVIVPSPSRMPYLIAALWISITILVVYIVRKEKTEQSDQIRN